MGAVVSTLTDLIKYQVFPAVPATKRLAAGVKVLTIGDSIFDFADRFTSGGLVLEHQDRLGAAEAFAGWGIAFPPFHMAGWVGQAWSKSRRWWR